MAQLRLIADDLTGALDTAAGFARVLGPVRVVWNQTTETGSLAFNTGTREEKRTIAVERTKAFANLIAPADGRLSFFKVDSLLRGNPGSELAAVLETLRFDSVVIAPAIPFQNRRTRGGRQQRLEPGAWVNTGEDIVSTLNAAGHFVAQLKAGDAVPAGISIFDAETEADLDAIVTATRSKGAVLYVGAAGLAGALARAIGIARPSPLPALPLLGLIGTDHSAMLAQITAIGDDHLMMGGDIEAAAIAATRRFSSRGFVFISCDLPRTGREAARIAIARRFQSLSSIMPRPDTLFVSGGETLAALCRDIGVSSLDVIGEFEPGLPIATVRGGLWDGITLLSKSGAFGAPDLLQRLTSAMTAHHAKATT